MVHTSRSRRREGLSLLILLACARLATAQLPDFGGKFGALGGGLGGAKQEVSLSAEFTPASGNRPPFLFVTAKIAPGFHVNAIDQGQLPDGSGPRPTEIKLADGSPVKLAGPFRSVQPPAVHIDAVIWKGLELREHTREVTWFAPLEIPTDADVAALTIDGKIDGQACDENMCVPIELEFSAHEGKGKELPAGALGDSPTAESGSPLARGGPPGLVDAVAGDSPLSLWTVALYGILGGVILNLMPCVLPVIGLKVLSFAKQGGQSRRHILGLNVAYAAGLLTVFMVLATLASLAQLGWGELYTLTWFKVAMTGLVFSMALAFLGVWEVPIPGFATSGKATELSSQEGPFGAFCMGIFTTLLATPCSGPFLGPVFGYTITQPPSTTYIVFGSVGLGMALPYLLVGAFPQLVSWLPKPGPWMEKLKEGLAFVLLATVVYLFSTIHHDYHLATLALLFSIWFGLWIVGHTPVWADRADRLRGWAKGIVAAGLVGGASYMLLLPSESELAWQKFSPAALAQARAEGKTVLVDFTANWCLTCKTNLKVAINRKEVRDLVERNGVVPMIADWTDKSETIKTALAELNSRSIPLLAIYPADPDREVLVLPDLLTQGRVLEALEEAGPSVNTAKREQVDAPEFGARNRSTVLQ